MTSQIEHEASNLQGGQRNASRNDGHLPECPRIQYTVNRHGYTLTAGSNGCICDRLRACEARVLQEIDRKAFALDEGDPFREAYRAGLDAAREAVAAVQGPLYNVRNSGDAQQGWDAMSRHALAAIDALREQQPQPLPPSVGVPTTPMWPAQ